MDNGYREYYQCIFPSGLYPVSSFNGFPRLFPGLCDLIPSDRNARLSFLILNDNDTQSPKPMNIILHCLSHNIPPSHPSIYPAAVSSTNPLAFVPHPFLLQLSHSSSLACFTGTLSENQFGSAGWKLKLKPSNKEVVDSD